MEKMTHKEYIKQEYGEPWLKCEWNPGDVMDIMEDYGKYCADQAWNDALKEVDALIQKPCWDLTLVEDIKKLKK